MHYSDRWNKRDMWNIIIIFMYLFFFKLQKVPYLSKIESTTLLGILLIFLLIVSYKYRCTYIFVLQKYKNMRLLFWCFLLILAALIVTTVHGEKDFSILRPLFHQFIFIFVSILVYSNLKVRGAEKKILEYIIIAYSLQTIIQYLSFVMPAFNTFTDLFKTEEAIRLKKQYDGFRLNAISGSLASGLACGYSIVTVVMLARWNELCFEGKYTKYICVVLLVLGGIAAGRVSIVLNVIGVVVLSILSFGNKKSIKLSNTGFKVILLSPFIILLVYIVANFILDHSSTQFLSRIDTVTNWLSNMMTHYSSRTPNNFWNFSYSKINDINVFFGDGLYTNPDGTYYLGVDAGFVRILAYGGLPWLFCMIAYQLCFFKYHGHFSEKLTLFIVIFIATLKSDSLSISLQNQLILVLLYLANNNNVKQEDGGYVRLQCRSCSTSHSI